MRYFVLLGLSLLLTVGCDETEPVHPPKPRTKDLIGVGIVETEAGELRVLAQEVDRWQEVGPVNLDNSPAYDPQYRFTTRTLRLEAGGRYFQSSGSGDDEYGLSLFYRKVADGYLSAGVVFSSCFDDGASLPMLSVRDESRTVRYVQLSCDYRYAQGEEWDETYVYPMHVVSLANGNLLFWGMSTVSGPARLTCVTEYGEVLWSSSPEGSPYSAAIASLRHDGFAIVDQLAEIVHLFDNGGVATSSIEFSTTDQYRIQSVVQLENSDLVIAGVDQTTSYSHLWIYSADGEELRDTAYVTEFCMDSVALYAVGDNILLVGDNGGTCSGPGAARMLLLDSQLNIIAEESFGVNAHTVLRDVTIGTDGSIFLCGATDRGNGSYSTLVAKYDSNLSFIWDTLVNPNL